MSADIIEENEIRYREGQSKKIAKPFMGKTDLFSYEHQTTLAPVSIGSLPLEMKKGDGC